MKILISFLLLFTLVSCAGAQGGLAGGPCEGCEAVFEYGERHLTPVDTLPDFNSTEPRIRISGTIYMPDGETTAEGVVLYVYHTDRQGVYPAPEDAPPGSWARRHGYIRGWVKTGADGRYTFYTFRPGSYSGNPAHIHPTLLEPDGTYYWASEFLFSDDPNLGDHGDSDAARGGSSGVITLRREGDLLVGERDFILGRNVPGYR